jgi:hypothetical protein
VANSPVSQKPVLFCRHFFKRNFPPKIIFYLGEGEGVAAAIQICFAAILDGNSDHDTASLVQPGSLLQILGEVDTLQDVPVVR